MTQMVLPQTPPPSDTGRNASDPVSRKSGDSEFDQVSQAEEKRMARKQADSRDDARRSAEKPDGKAEKTDGKAEKRQDASAPSKHGQTRESQPENRQKGAPSETTGAESDEETVAGIIPSELLSATESEAPVPEFAFAGLQSMPTRDGADPLTRGALFGENGMPVSGSRSESGGMLKGMLMMALGKSENLPGKTASVQFSEMMAPQSAQDLLRTPDPTSLLSQRVPTAPELPAQQQTALNGRMSGEPIPLKGYTTSVDVPVWQAEWGDKVMGKLTWLTANKLSVAEIHLSPPDMGPMEVRVQVQQDQTSITVHAANPAVRDQLELHSHRLRDMLGEQGLNLENFDVSDSPQQQTGERTAEDDSGHGGGNAEQTASGDGMELVEDSGNMELSWKGEVDIFA